METIESREQLLALRPWGFFSTDIPPEEIISWFKVLDAGWLYQGEPDPSKPHAELASGLCSNGYFNCRKVMCYPNLLEILAIQMVRRLKAVACRMPDAIVGSPYSAITLSYEVARAFGVPHFFAEKDPQDPSGKKMVWKEEIPADHWVLQVEELITTMGTTEAVQRAVIEKNSKPVIFLPEVVTCIHRPSQLPANTGERKVVALVERQVSAWKPEECPYCKVGSPRVKPKANWAQLVGRV